ncbi:hypothetical protein BCR41DRAFT_372026 [Lobosporangium transversale]|uniref:Uncharacterized protein n=1 Tax=Lobosporangium transversale TaxID=64571 RepID=A0A1Y2GLM4_9FUNG|nr:hypothetical protein BCR41DRAFT_372295 [Lobosporangium transversale]XP_021879778.1 hypothetical protein BCR41DRAFT_372026 [Lobosporangium transversale]ORZ11012.1 hypothetical protein BCR41DRAFT_372295 [Lobosporangium transversale]ORZ11681.1 hypothetical protein BCR41DRAFT_372026 [Lobosporangium transversale]|eukprot:XP_021879529.1 hypothetical protein BCR41DRAFT_372295 [Lobosporangium transversale]
MIYILKIVCNAEKNSKESEREWTNTRLFRNNNTITASKINEREGCSYFTWNFISGALDLLEIQTGCFEKLIIVNGGQAFKRKESASRADGIAVNGEGHQIYLAEAALLNGAIRNTELFTMLLTPTHQLEKMKTGVKEEWRMKWIVQKQIMKLSLQSD